LLTSVSGGGTEASFFYPTAITVDSGGNVYVAGGNSTIVKITQAGVASLFAGRPWEGIGIRR
jgi:hypothetical protein